MFVETLPEEARLSYPVGEYEPWTRQDELLTQVLELVGLGVAERRLKKPFEPHRPSWHPASKAKDAVTDPDEVTVDTTGPIRGHAAIMARVQAQGHLRVVPDAS